MIPDLRALTPILDAALDAVVVIDESDRVRAWNAAAEASFGWTREEAIGVPMVDLIVPERLHRAHLDGLSRFLRTGEAHVLGRRIEIEARHRDGREFPVELAITLAVMGGERLFVGYLRDISERRHAVEALRASEARLVEERARLTTLIENLPVGVCFVAPDGESLLSNRAYRRYAPDGAIPSRTPDAEAHWIAFDETGARLPRDRFVAVRALQGETIEGVEFLYRPDMGPEIWTRISGVPLMDAGGDVAAAIVVVTDIDDLKRTQRALQDLNETLEQRVAVEVAERARTEEALRHAQKMEAMGQLTGGVAHDFNNLLTPIIGGLDILQRSGPADERAKRLISGALASADRARTLVQRLLAFARRQPLQPLPTDVGKIIDSMAELIGSTVGPRIRVAVDIQSGLPPALAEVNQLEMAILNLAVNARDAMPEGGALNLAAEPRTLERSEGELVPGRYIVISVADTGTGMDEVTLARAVEPFFSTKGVGRGTGLGLSMVHGLAAQLGGAVKLHSAPGLGTNVELWLPEAATGEPAETAPSSVRTTPQAGIALLVDDEDLVRDSTAEMLAELGFRVVEVESAETALAKLRAGLTADLVITDHLMPGITGSELAHQLNLDRPDLPVLVISGYADLEGLSPELPRLAKPFLQRELAEAIAALQRSPLQTTSDSDAG